MLTDQQNRTITELADEMGVATSEADPVAHGAYEVTFWREYPDGRRVAGSALVLPDGQIRGATPSVRLADRAIARREAACSAG